MSAKRISAAPAGVDLAGLPAARLRAVLRALSSAEAAEIFDAQLADLHAEWLAARARSRVHAAWIGACIRAHLLTCAAYYSCVSLGVPALRTALIIGIAAYITLALFLGLANLIAPRPAQGHIVATSLPTFTRLTLPEKRDDWIRPKKPEPPRISRAQGPALKIRAAAGPDDGKGQLEGVETTHLEWIDTEPAAPAASSLGGGAICVPMVRSEPDYPLSAQRRRIEGYVTVEVAIDGAGAVSGAEVLQSEPAGVFDAAVLRAVKRWRYQLSGDTEASCSRAQVRLRFELPGTR